MIVSTAKKEKTMSDINTLLSQPQINPTEEHIITRQEVEDAWRAQLAAVDAWEDSGYDEALREDMDQALAHAQVIEALFHDQYRRTVWYEDGTTLVLPKFTEALINGHHYKVQVLRVVKANSLYAVQVRALPIGEWQPRPFSMASIGMDPLETGAVPLENIRVNGNLLGVI
jgi:hypothetical protein